MLLHAIKYKKKLLTLIYNTFYSTHKTRRCCMLIKDINLFAERS